MNTENLENMDLDAKITEYYTYGELLKDENNSHKISDLDNSLKLSVSTLVLTIAENMPDIDKLVLTNLTGVSLENTEQVYDYLSKTLDLSANKIFEWGMVMFSEVDLMNMMREPNKQTRQTT